MVDPRLATVLNVNDDDANRYLVNRILEMSGYKVLEAATGMGALLMAEQHRPDVVILDVKLPDISGYEVCERLRANPGTASMAVLHTSATFVDVAGRRTFAVEAARNLLAEMQQNRALIDGQGVFANDAERTLVLSVYEEGISLMQQRIDKATE